MSAASFDSVTAVLLIPIGSAALLAVLPGYRLTARLNVAASFLTFLAALSLFTFTRVISVCDWLSSEAIGKIKSVFGMLPPEPSMSASRSRAGSN